MSCPAGIGGPPLFSARGGWINGVRARWDNGARTARDASIPILARERS